jgi:hypothetical protein
MILRISVNHFLKQHQPIDLCNGEALCFLCGRNRVIKYDLNEFRASKRWNRTQLTRIAYQITFTVGPYFESSVLTQTIFEMSRTTNHVIQGHHLWTVTNFWLRGAKPPLKSVYRYQSIPIQLVKKLSDLMERQKFRHRVQKSMPSDFILSHLNPVHILISYFSKIHLKFSSHLRLGLVAWDFPTKLFTLFSFDIRLYFLMIYTLFIVIRLRKSQREGIWLPFRR